MGSTRTPPAATAKWCIRSLRPLNSAILRLERYWELNSTQYNSRRSQQGTGDNANGRRTTAEPGRADASDAESANNDPTWVPDNTMRKRVKHKYSGRARTKVIVQTPEVNRLQPGEFTVATPLILGTDRRVVDNNRGDGDSLDATAPTESKRKPINYDLFGVDGDFYRNESYFAAVGSVFTSMDAFLKTTAPEQDAENFRGAPSLLSMALRKTSEYIFYEQERLDNAEDVDEDIDVADIFFTDLEDTYTSSNQGWKPLRALVRAHGIRLVCEVIRRELIPPKLSRFFVMKALQGGANDAAEALLGAVHSVVSEVKPPDTWKNADLFDEAFAGSSALGCYLKKTNNFTVFFREVTDLLLRGVLPPEWMTTLSMTKHVGEAINCILRDDDEHSAAAASFLNAVLRKSMHCVGSESSSSQGCHHTEAAKYATTSHPSRPVSRSRRETTNRECGGYRSDETSIHKSLNNTICCILMCLCGGHIVRFGNNLSLDSLGWHIITDVSAVVQKHIERTAADGKLEASEDKQVRMAYIMLSQFLLEYLELPGDPPRDTPIYSPLLLNNFNNFILLSCHRKELVDKLSSFIHQVQVFLTRGERTYHDVARPTGNLIESATLKPYPLFRAALAKAIVKFAHTFAEYSRMPRHHAWVAELQEKVADFDLDVLQYGAEPVTPSLCLAAAGFRWEDGIGEWVARTPCARHRGRRQPANLKQLHQREPVNEVVDESTTTDEESVSDSENDSDAESSRDQPRSSATPTSSPLPFSRKRKFCPSYCEVDPDEETTVSDTVSDAQEQRKQNRRQTLFGVHADHKADDEPCGPMTRNQRALQDNNKTNTKRSSQTFAVAIAVELPPSAPRKTSNFEVVIRTNTNLKGRPGTPWNKYGGVERKAEGENEDDDIITSAPTFTKCRRSKRLRHSFPQAGLRLPARVVPGGQVRGRRRVSERLAIQRGQQVIVPCSNRNDSSEDELSFL